MEKQQENQKQESLKEVLEFVREAIDKAKQWKMENFNVEQLPEMVLKQFDKVHHVLSELGDSTDFNNVLPVYLNIAKYLSNHFDQDMIFSLGAAITLCHEKEIVKLVAEAKQKVFKIEAHYRKAEPYTRETRLFFNRDGKPAEFHVTQVVTRDDLPSDVREEFLRTDKALVTINLYPEEV